MSRLLDYCQRFKEWTENGGWIWLILGAFAMTSIVVSLTKDNTQQYVSNNIVDEDTLAVESSTPIVQSSVMESNNSETVSSESLEETVGSIEVEAIVVEIDAACNMSIKDRVTLLISYFPSDNHCGVTHINGKEWGKTPYGSKYVVANELSHYKALQMYRFSVRRSNNIFFLFNTNEIEMEW